MLLFFFFLSISSVDPCSFYSQDLPIIFEIVINK